MEVTEERLRSIIKDELNAIEQEKRRRMKETIETAAAKPLPTPKKETHLFLISFRTNGIAIPDEHGRAISVGAAYAWCNSIFGEVDTRVILVAEADGRKLKTPLPCIIQEWSSMVQVEPATIGLEDELKTLAQGA